jgi:hypothetical protein
LDLMARTKIAPTSQPSAVNPTAVVLTSTHAEKERLP